MADPIPLKDKGEDLVPTALYLMGKPHIEKRNIADTPHLVPLQDGSSCNAHPVSPPQGEKSLAQFVLVSIKGIFPYKLHSLLNLPGRHKPGPSRIPALSPAFFQKKFFPGIPDRQRASGPQADFLELFKMKPGPLQNLPDMQGKNPENIILVLHVLTS